MRIEVKLTAESRQTIERIRRRPAELTAAIEQGLKQAGHVAAGVVIDKVLSGQVLKRRHGDLARAVASRAEGSGLDTIAYVGVTKGRATKYAAKLERGGIIRPDTKQFLAVPLKAALTATGRPRYPRGPKSVPGLFLITSRAGNKLLVRKTGDGRAFTPMYVLKTSVRIPKFKWLTRGMKLARPAVTRTLQRQVDRALGARG